jgi:hypothetical protein
MTLNRRSNRTKPNYPPGRVGGTCAARTVAALERQPDGQILDTVITEGAAVRAQSLPPDATLACPVAHNTPIARRQKIRGHSMPIVGAARGAV